MIITGATREVLADEVHPMVEQFLAERGLSLSPEKTRITHIDEGLNFLGMNVLKYGGKRVDHTGKRERSALFAQAMGHSERQCNDPK